MKSEYVQYYVEGEDEEKLINVLKTELRLIRSGKVQRLNVVEREFTNARLMLLRPKTMVVLVFDTDTNKVATLNRNLKILKKCSNVSEVVTIPQKDSLEDELIRSCNIRKITDLLGSKSKEEFKSDIIQTTNLAKKLMEHQFDIKQFWSCQPLPPYQNIINQADKIKL